MAPARDRVGETQRRDQGAVHTPRTIGAGEWITAVLDPLVHAGYSELGGGGRRSCHSVNMALPSWIAYRQFYGHLHRIQITPSSLCSGTLEYYLCVWSFTLGILITQTSDLIHFYFMRRSAEEGMLRWGRVWIAS